MVLPVTVMQLPLMKPLASRYLSSAGVPPTLWTSSITYLGEEVWVLVKSFIRV
jgi:hypothetical protein